MVGWQSFNADATLTEKVLQQFGNTTTVNPLSWAIGNEWIPAEQNEGVLIPDSALVRGQVSARIEKHGLLLVKTPPAMKAWLKNVDNFHGWDYNLFLGSVLWRILKFKDYLFRNQECN
ncbi:hypothetical protein OHD16_19520 [Sphingobacterium sp. ML3W]|uniref:hypothetical protein n=1 Tax=Sphingobacterium sp. ML3W TaxID=1538644 RepID=UPI00249B7B14|nr:hypothetical protein [Sphingobacterium sp. ML3W]WFA82149.1 hypothetical protein OGI71_12660 [Sphingobacterium sp. ML3W]